MNLGNLFESSFGAFFAKHRFEAVVGGSLDDPRGRVERFANGDFHVELWAQPSASGSIIAGARICPPTGPDNLGWLPADRVLAHVTGRPVDSEDLASTASAMDAHYDLIQAFFRDDEGYSDRWHLLRAYGNRQRVFVAPRWSD